MLLFECHLGKRALIVGGLVGWNIARCRTALYRLRYDLFLRPWHVCEAERERDKYENVSHSCNNAMA